MIKDKFYLISPASLLVSDTDKNAIYVRVIRLSICRVEKVTTLIGVQSYNPRVTGVMGDGSYQGVTGL